MRCRSGRVAGGERECEGGMGQRVGQTFLGGGGRKDDGAEHEEAGARRPSKQSGAEQQGAEPKAVVHAVTPRWGACGQAFYLNDTAAPPLGGSTAAFFTPAVPRDSNQRTTSRLSETFPRRIGRINTGG